MEKDIKQRNFTNLLAFIALIAVAAALIAAFICAKLNVAGGIVSALTKISTVLSCVVTALCSFFYVKNKRSFWLTIIYVIALVLVIVFIILA